MIRKSLLILATILLGSCTNSSDCFREDVFCAGLVTDTLGIDDHGVNQDAWLGLQQSKSEGVTDEVAYIESVDTRDYEKNIDYFIFGHRHLPVDFRLSGTSRYINLGDWISYFTYAVFDGENLELKSYTGKDDKIYRNN